MIGINHKGTPRDTKENPYVGLGDLQRLVVRTLSGGRQWRSGAYGPQEPIRTPHGKDKHLKKIDFPLCPLVFLCG
jgi:hypothetical protein